MICPTPVEFEIGLKQVSPLRKVRLWLKKHSYWLWRSMVSRLPVIILTVSIALVALMLAKHSDPSPFLLLNDSPSEPTGLYLRIRRPAHVGALVAFKTPKAAFAYVDRHHASLRRHPILKEIAAARGAHVCSVSGVIEIDGAKRAMVASEDRFGDPLPRWRGCRALLADELFVFSGRIPNSFDSRYFGPISRSEVLGVYKLILPLSLGRD